MSKPKQEKMALSPVSARVAVFVVLVGAYAATGARQVTFVDSGELLATAAELGVAHAPGTPLYTLLLSPFVTLFGAAGGFYFSTLCALLCAMIVFEIARLLQVSTWVGTLAALIFGLSRTIWFYASVTEVYTFHTMLALSVLFCVLKAYELGTRKWVALAGLFFGLSLCVHHLSSVLLAPGYLFLLNAAIRKHKLNWKPTFGALILFSCLGLLPYLYLVWAASRPGVFLWADTSTWQGFWFHVSGRQYQSLAFSMPTEAIFSQLGYAFSEIAVFFTPLALLPLSLGLWSMRNKQHRFSPFAVFALLGVGFNVLYVIGYRMADDRDAYLLVSHLALLVPFLFGLQLLALRTNPWLLVASACTLLLAYPKITKKNFSYGERYVKDVLSVVPAGGVLMSWDWNFSSPYMYLYTTGYRRDAVVLDMHLLRKSVYTERVLPARYPAFAKKFAGELEKITTLTKIFERGEGTPKDEILAAVKSLGHAIVNTYPTFATLSIDDDLSQNTLYIPLGATTKIVPQTANIAYVPEGNFDWRFWSEADGVQDEPLQTKVLPQLARNYANRAHFEVLFGNKARAVERLEQASVLFPHLSGVFFIKGQVFNQLGDKAQASKAYARAIELEPGNTVYLSALSNVK